jgi:hypothetical protein
MELLLCGARYPTPLAPAPGILGRRKSDSRLSVSVPPPNSLLLRHHPQFLTLSCGGAHNLLIPHQRGGMRVIFLISRHLVRHLAIRGALALFQLY